MSSKSQNFFYTFLALLAIILAIAMIFHPEATFQGASIGFKTWVMVLIPALLPFFIIADIMVELGVLNFLGVLLEPLMRPLFKQPGAAGFVLAMGFTSGFPMGAVLTNRLYENKLCTKEEAARLIAFTNNSSPLFLLVAVPVGMFGNPTLGILLAISHYAANLLLGIFLGLKKRKSTQLSLCSEQQNLFSRSYQALVDCQQEGSKSLGSLMGKAVNKSINSILMIGGFVIFFAVLVEIFQATGIFLIMSIFFAKVLAFLNFAPLLSSSLTTGIFEMTLGAKTTSEVSAPLIQQAMLVSFILGWSGLSIQAQVTSIVSQNGIPIGYYILGRFFQGTVAAVLTGILYQPIFSLALFTQPVFSWDKFETIGAWYYLSFNFIAALAVLTILLCTSLAVYIFKQLTT